MTIVREDGQHDVWDGEKLRRYGIDFYRKGGETCSNTCEI
jgi:hypothetical protein